MSYFKVLTQGQTLVVNITENDATSVTTYEESSLTTAHTLPLTITSDTEFHFAAGANYAPHILTVSQLDGTTLYSATVEPHPSKPHIIGPVPSATQAAGDIGSHNKIFGRLQSGQYYFCGNAAGSSTSAVTLSQLRLSPWYVPNQISIAKIGAEVTGAGTAGSVFRIGLYADDGNGYPGDLVLDAGTIDGTSATVQDITLGTAEVLDPGLYWVGGAGQVAAPTMRTHNVFSPLLHYRLGTTIPGSNQTVNAFTQSSVTGALPSTFTTTPTFVGGNAGPRIHVKIS